MSLIQKHHSSHLGVCLGYGINSSVSGYLLDAYLKDSCAWSFA